MWIARDKDGSIWLFDNKPVRREYQEVWVCEDFANSCCVDISELECGNFALSEVTWENSPKEIIIKD